jgi:hypothetical protein
MVIKDEYKIRADGVKLYRTYSDEGNLILQNETGTVYVDAIDVENAPYTYSEYEEPINTNGPADPEDTDPETPEGTDESVIMTRAELTDKVNELDEAIELILSGVTE